MKVALWMPAVVASLAFFVAAADDVTADLPQLSVGKAGPCCPSPRFLAPRSRDGKGARAAFDAPAGIAYDPDDDAYFITEAANNTIRRMDSNGVVTTVAGACDRELVRNTCVGRELDGAASMARFNIPTAIVYDGHRKRLIIYDRGSSVFRVMTPDGLVRRAGSACCINGLAINDRNGFIYAAQGRYVSLVRIDPDDTQVYRIWTAPVEGDRDAPIFEVNNLAVDQNSGDIYASVSGQQIYRLNLSRTWHGSLWAGQDTLSFMTGGLDFAPDASRSTVQFHSLSAMAFDAARRTLYVSDFRTIRAVQADAVRSVAGGCRRQSDPRHGGEFACDYPANDGQGMDAHFSWPITGLAIDSRRGTLAILSDSAVKEMDTAYNVRTIAGNRNKQAQQGPSNWNGRYLDTENAETLDVQVQGDYEVETFSNRSGQVFDVRRGLRSLAANPAQFWNADSYVRIGHVKSNRTVAGLIRALGCGDLRPYARKAGERGSFSMSWYDSFPRGQIVSYFRSARCVDTRVANGRGQLLYEDVESIAIPHFVPSGLTEYPDQRILFH